MTEEALKARRERSDKISKIMGNYLLRGYKMMSTTCDICQTILLQNRKGENYCIGCEEVDCVKVKEEQVKVPEVKSVNPSQNHIQSNQSSSKNKNISDQNTIKNIYSYIDELNASFQSGDEQMKKSMIIIQLKTCYETLALIPNT